MSTKRDALAGKEEREAPRRDEEAPFKALAVGGRAWIPGVRNGARDR